MLFNRFLFSPLFDPADPDGGNAGGGDAHPPQEPADPNGGEAPPEVNEALLNALLSKLTDAIKPIVETSVNTTVNSTMGRLDRDLKALKKTITPAPAAATATDGETPRERELRERLENEQRERREEREQVEARELDAEIKAAIAAQPFSDQEGKNIAFDWYKAKATRDDDGNLVISDKPLAQFIQNHAPRAFEKFMRTRENVGGSGNATNRNSSVKGFSIEQIRPGMSAEEDAMARTQLSQAFAERSKRF